MINTLIGALMAVVMSAPSRILAALGMGFITFGGLALIYDQLKTAVLGHWGALSGAIFQLLSLIGFPMAIGIVLGAFAARVTMMSLSKLGKLTQ